MRTSYKMPILIFRTASSAMLVLTFFLQLADVLPPVFPIVFSAAAIASGLILERLRFRIPVAAALTAVLFFLLRAAVFLIAGAISRASDSAALSFVFFRFDSGFFPMFPAAVYLSMSYFLVNRNPRYVFAEVVVNTVLLMLLLWNQAGENLTIFPHPGMLTVFIIVFFIIQITIILLQSTESKSSFIAAGYLAAAVPLFLLTVFLFYGFYSENVSKERGGLMQPTLFRFDFSDYVKLETEISMSNDLVMLFRNYGYLNSIYLRRFYLSGYRPDRGFFLQNGPGEKEQPLNIPERPARLDYTGYPKRIKSEQEYFIVNFDPSSLIAMNFPVEIFPLTNWQGSSFLRNYRVVSETVEQPSWELSEAEILEMPGDLFDFYTQYGNDEKVKELAEEVTAGLVTAYDKVIAIMFYLHDSYFYSLKPGVAGDGNQLHHFLFESRKGYCSYFAFSMALMCRSIGIPARVAAGFFIDPQSGILNVYPVREDMAHAWVEVPFDGFGWVEFDPTTDRLAPGEDLEFSALDSSEYSDLVEEIFQNNYDVEELGNAGEVPRTGNPLVSAVKSLVRFLKLNPGWVLLILYSVIISFFHIREAVLTSAAGINKRLAACYRRSLRLAAAFGFGKRRGESVIEHAERAESSFITGYLDLAESYLESTFAAGMDKESIQKAGRACEAFAAGYAGLPRLKRFIVYLFPFVRLRPGSRAVSAVLVFLLLSVAAPGLHAQSAEPGGVESLLEMAGRESDAENYEAALKLLNDGIDEYPDDWRLKKAAGDLYADRELYNLALEQYVSALELAPENPEVIYQKSVVEGLLNRDEESISSLESLLEIVPDHYDALADLGWMYFKTFRLSRAEELLLGAIELYGDSPILYMTLGTVYSGMYDYSAAEKYYLESIDMALKKGWDYFASVSYYNLSLLEHGFYHFEKALEYTNRSIEMGERAPGYISRAEIYLGRLDFDTAFMNFQQAYTVDSTPLAMMGQAELYLTFGMLDEALAHINEVLKYDDESWMYYFGVDPDRHRMETDRLLMEIYSGLAQRERFNPVFGIRRLSSVFNSLKFRSLSWFYGRRYRKASFNVGRSNEAHGNLLDASWAYFKANEEYNKQALRYLRRSAGIEVAVAPEAEPSYTLEEAKLRKDPALLAEAIAGLDQEWELLQVSEALAWFVRLEMRRNPEAACEYAGELYLVNPGAFITEGIRFPVILDFKPGLLLRIGLRRGGFKILPNNTDYDYRYRLAAADKQDRGVLYSVYDSRTNEVLLSISEQGGLNTPKKISAFIAELKKRLFRISDG